MLAPKTDPVDCGLSAKMNDAGIYTSLHTLLLKLEDGLPPRQRKLFLTMRKAYRSCQGNPPAKS